MDVCLDVEGVVGCIDSRFKEEGSYVVVQWWMSVFT